MLKLLRFLIPYRVSVLVVLVLIFLQTMSQLYLPALMADIVDTGIIQGDTGYILEVGGLMLVVVALGSICMIGASFLSAKVSAGFGRDLRDQVFTKIEGYSLQEFYKIGTASLITRTTNDITQVQQVVLMFMRMMVSAPLMCIGGIIMAVSEDRRLSLILVVVIPFLASIIFFIAQKGVPLFKKMQVKLDKLNLVLREGLTGIRVIRAFNRAEYEKRRFVEANADLTETAIKVNKIMAALMPLMMFVMNLTTVAIIWFGGMRIDSGDMQVGSLMAFIQYVMQIMFSLIMVSMMFVMIPRASASAVRINEVLDIRSTILDPLEAKIPRNIRGQIEFENVTFSYPGAGQPVLNNISFSAGPGETTAVIGGTGSGKSTLVGLIPRLYDVDCGRILVDGLDVREMPQDFLRSIIGYVPQKPVLFSATIEENIRYGKEDATEDEIKHAANIAQADEFIDALEEGYNYSLAQGGSNISGGQKQRLSIARAIVRRPEIYIFDDSFSALDFKTDARLRAALKKETAASTVLIVAQRVSTIMYADRIIVLDRGQIAGIGSHKELLQKCQVYREIVSSQLSEEEIA